MRLLFWNVNRKQPFAQLAALARHQVPDLFGLAECLMSPAEVLAAINGDRAGAYRVVATGSSRVHLYARDTVAFIRRVAVENRHLGLSEISTPTMRPVLLGVVHLRSPLWSDEDTRRELAATVVRLIEAEEARCGHRRTIVIGDVNMPPHERGLTSFSAFNVTPYRDVLRRTGGRRRFQGQEKSFFFGPLPVIDTGPRGVSTGCSASYFKTFGETVEPYWFPLDRALVRPELADRFSDDQMRVLTYDGAAPLIRPNGVPDDRLSDHLPICLDIALEEA